MRILVLVLSMWGTFAVPSAQAKPDLKSFVPKSAQSYPNGTMIVRGVNRSGEKIRIVRTYHWQASGATNQTHYVAISNRTKAPMKLGYADEVVLKRSLGRAIHGVTPTVPWKSLSTIGAMRAELPPAIRSSPLE